MPFFASLSHSAIHWERSAPRHHPDVRREKANMLNMHCRKYMP